jgi:hypothetical protein
MEVAARPMVLTEFLGTTAVEHVEAATSARLAKAEKLFAVQLKPQPLQSEAPKDQFDFLFMDDIAFEEHNRQATLAIGRSPIKAPEMKPPSAEDERAAVSTMISAMNSDETIEAIIRKHRKPDDNIPEVVKQLQTDAAFRVELGAYLRDKIDRKDLEYMLPYRVRLNTQKSPVLSQYKSVMNRLTSRDYSSMIALSMLDGTFDVDKSQSETITYDSRTDEGVGQHRTAAKVLLEASDGNEKTLGELFNL